jgi:hypothetical protein
MMDIPRVMPIIQLSETVAYNPGFIKKHPKILLGLGAFIFEECLNFFLADNLYRDSSELAHVPLMTALQFVGLSILNFTRPFRYNAIWKWVADTSLKEEAVQTLPGYFEKEFTTCVNGHVLHLACATRLDPQRCPLCRQDGLQKVSVVELINKSIKLIDDTCCICLDPTVVESQTVRDFVKNLPSSLSKKKFAFKRLVKILRNSKIQQIKLEHFIKCFKNNASSGFLLSHKEMPDIKVAICSQLGLSLIVLAQIYYFISAIHPAHINR